MAEFKGNKKRIVRLAAMIVCGAVFAGSLAMYLYSRSEYSRNQAENEDAQSIAGMDSVTSGSGSGIAPALPEGAHTMESLAGDDMAKSLLETDLEALREYNSEVIGWICIPGTRVNYPLMQGEDNEYYLNHTWKGKYNEGGSIFLEAKCSKDFSDFNTIVYGHRMSNTSMFGALASYKKQAFWEEHRSVYICLDGLVRKYDIFAAYEPKVTDCTYWVQYDEEKYKKKVLDFALEKSVIDCGIKPTVLDDIITLSTCTGNGHSTRWVVQAVLSGELKKAEDR